MEQDPKRRRQLLREAVSDGDLLLLSVNYTAYNPFLLCSRLKRKTGSWITVVLICDEEERELVESMAHFCMVDGILFLDPEIPVEGPGSFELLTSILERPKPTESVDVLLARIEGRLGADAATLANRVITSLSTQRDSSFVDQVSDAETGLFCCAYMAFKLDEEFKRSSRFHQPLTLVLMDLPGLRALCDTERVRTLGEVSGVLLNVCRDVDSMGRYDDSSFLLLLPNTGWMGAKVLAERILEGLSALEVSSCHLDPAIAIVSMPRSDVQKKDDLLDLGRLTLVSAWAAEGKDRVQVAE